MNKNTGIYKPLAHRINTVHFSNMVPGAALAMAKPNMKSVRMMEESQSWLYLLLYELQQTHSNQVGFQYFGILITT